MPRPTNQGVRHAISEGNALASRALPAADTPIPLDNLLARTAPPPSRTATARDRWAAPGGTARFGHTDRPASPRSPSAIPSPRALVLVVNVATCLACGTVSRAVNRGTLVRCDEAGHANCITYTSHDIQPYLLLPRERKEYHYTVPLCEACF